MANPKPSAKATILNLIKRLGPLTARQIASALEISAVAARKHLISLEADGLIQAFSRRVPRGRPTLVYGLTPSAEDLFPQRYQELAVDILSNIRDVAGQEMLQRLFDARYERVRRVYEARLSDQSLAERLRDLARLRDEDGYMAVVEEADEGYVLREHHCPIQEVAMRFPEACACEEELFRRLLNREVSRQSTRVDGAACCTYVIGPGS